MEKKEFENDYTDINKKYLIIIIILIIAFLAIISLYVIREQASNRDNNSSNTNTNISDTNVQDDDEELDEKEMVWTNREPGKEVVYDVFLKDKQLYVNEKIVDEKIKEYITVQLGSDVCLGNTYVILLKEDNTIGALSLDGLVCSNEVRYNEKVDDLVNVKKIYSEKIDEETDVVHNAVYADTSETSKIDISDYLENK